MRRKGTFDIDVANKYGVHAAVLIEYLYKWICHNRKNKSIHHFHGGKYWTYYSMKKYSEKIECLTVRHIQLAIEKLESAGEILSDNFNHTKADRTKWYTLSDELMHFLDNGEQQSQPTANEPTDEETIRVHSILDAIDNLEVEL